jgi:glycosyltransferase involved in cell wall biosynthesis
MGPRVSRLLRVAHVATIDLTVRALLLPQLCGLRDAGFEVSAVSAPGPSIREVEAEGIRCIPWRNVTRAWDPKADVRAFFELVGILNREQFDIVHTHTAKPGVMGRVGARLVGTPCIVNTVHGFDAPRDAPITKRVAFMAAEWGAARFSDLEFYQGYDDLLRAQRLRMVRGSKGVFLGNGTDLSRFDPCTVDPRRLGALRMELGVPSGSCVVGTIGRLVGDKGFRELFTAARKVRRAMPNVRFLAVGGTDPAKDDAITQREMERESENFTFAGWREDIPELLALMDVFALPSWREGVPRSAIEASSMGLPLVLSDIPGCRQVARDGIEAIFVPRRDPDRLAAAILKLAQDGELRQRMGAAARARAVERFDERRIIRTICDKYERVLARKGLRV